MSDHSINPAGERFALPDKGEYATELARLEKLAAAARAEGKEVVVVMGVGFVGAVMAAIVADTVDKRRGKPEQVRHRLPAAQHRAATGRSRCSTAASRR